VTCPATFGVHWKVATPLTIGIAALIGAPLRVNPTVPWVLAGAKVAVKVTGTPWVIVGGAVSEIVPPEALATMASCAEVLAEVWAPAAGT